MSKAQQGEGHYAAPSVNNGSARGGIEVCGQLDLGPISIYSGSGVPGRLVNGGAPEVGDLFIRSDGTVGSLIYRCTVVGPPPTWAVVL
jgi:hypothetical protein